MKGTILQPTYLPWMGYFDMIDSSDIYVMFDHIQFEKKSWQQRNKIKTANGVIWLTIPVKEREKNARICDTIISYDRENPLEKHMKSITLAYKKAPYFSVYKSLFEDIYSSGFNQISVLNCSLINTICGILGVKTKIISSSNLNLGDEKMEKTEKVINLCKKVDITHLYDGKVAEEFLDKSLLEKAGISITFQNFKHPTYKQLWGDFIPYLSVIDLLFNEGDKSLEIIRSGK